jgi:hypothetical protein
MRSTATGSFLCGGVALLPRSVTIRGIERRSGVEGRDMKVGRLFGGAAALAGFVGAAVLYAGTPVRGFDFQDSPAVIARPGADISDVYLFPSPSNAGNVVVVMDVHPAIAAGAGTKTYFDHSVLYTMKFDSNFQGEAVGSRPIETKVMQFSMGIPGSGTQQIFFYGLGTPNQTGSATTLINSGTVVGSGYINRIFTTGTGITVFAGAREDPFFFDLAQWWNIIPDRDRGSTNSSCLPAPFGNDTCPQGFNPPGTAVDYFNNSNVLSIVVELPRTLLTSNTGNTIIAYWATTSSSTGQ